MIIELTAAGITLVAPEDVKGFKLVAPAGLTGDALATALGEAGRLVGEHAWISPAWVRAASGLAGDAAWEKGFAGMVAYATTKGWVDDTGAIRAHIERV